MRYPTQSDIEEMMARGYDPVTIAEQTELAKRGLIAEAIKNEIRNVFASVVLGAGVGLYEANGLDDYANEEALAKYRASDERHDWSAIPLKELNRYSSSLSFFDAEGMRFHIPAYLIADIDGNYGFDLPFHLSQSIQLEERFSLLNTEQRAVIRKYLQFMIEEESHAFDRERIQRALNDYWAN